MTAYGLQKWHNAMFEKLGWMVLAQAKGYDDKVVQYKNSIDHLIETIKHVMKEYEDHNRKHDLNVLLMNAEVLREHAAKDF
jgi:archaellum component FlaC